MSPVLTPDARLWMSVLPPWFLIQFPPPRRILSGGLLIEALVYQNTLSVYFENRGSLVTKNASSVFAWAISRRSKGSL